MQLLRFALRNLWRDLKSGELSVLLLALARGGAVADRGGLLHQPHRAGRARAGGRGAGRRICGSSRRIPIPAGYFAKSAQFGLARARRS